MQGQLIDPKDLLKINPKLTNINLHLCVECKSTKLLCGEAVCPLIQTINISTRVKDKVDSLAVTNSVFGPSPQIFIGSYDYPNLNTGPMTSLFPEESKIMGKPSDWVSLAIEEIIDLRFGLIRGKQKANANFQKDTFSSKLQDQVQELAMSVKPVEIEGIFAKKPVFDIKLNSETQPMGPSGVLSKFDITSNPKIPVKVESTLTDEITSFEQMNTLYGSGYDVYYLQNLFSTGSTGRDANAKLVPTRWSITATDDIIGKHQINQLRDLPEVNNIQIYTNNFLGNYFTVSLLPGRWQFENFETWIPGSIFTIAENSINTSVNREGFTSKEVRAGRNNYASQAGGYYASRLAVLEHLHKINRQARVIVIREITPEYTVPVGVWAVREGMRKTMDSSPTIVSSLSELKQLIQSKIQTNLDNYIQKSELFNQRTLLDYFF